MKFFCFIFLFVIVLLNSNHGIAQCNDWSGLQGYKNAYIRDVAVDRFGNLYAIGNFTTQDFKIGTTTLPLQGTSSIFILKFDKTKTLQWARSVGSIDADYGMTVKVDNEDNIVIAGYYFSPSVTFDCFTLYKSGRMDMYVAKYSSQGYALWAIGTTGIQDGFNSDITITVSNNIIVTSSFVAGNALFAGQSIPGFGGYDSFVVALAPSGKVNWIKSFGGAGSEYPDYILGVASDSKENILITGYFESPQLVFGSTVVHAFTVSENYFVAKLDNFGNSLWAKEGQMPVDQAGFDVAVDKSDNICVTGRFGQSQTSFGNIILTSFGGTDAFVVKYDASGNVVDARNFGGDKYDSGEKIAVDNEDHVIVSGYYYSNLVTFDSFTETKTDFASDTFIATLDNQLTATCTKVISGSADNYMTGMVTDKANNIWLVVVSIIGGTTRFDNVYSVDDNDFSDMAIALGNAQNFDALPIIKPEFLKIDLGPDSGRCSNSNETILDAGYWCGGTYTWNDGSHNQHLKVIQDGVYWVEVQQQGKIGRDTIVIQTISNLHVDLGKDKTICQGNEVYFDVTQPSAETYGWDNKSTSPVRTINSTGKYWVKISNHCETVFDSVSITTEPKINFDLGDNRKLCSNTPVVIGVDKHNGYNYAWQDGSTLSRFNVIKSGTYTITVSNICEAVKDSVTIIFQDNANIVIANVITRNSDGKNDTYLLPDDLIGSSVEILNRWGDNVYQTNDYQNNWAGGNLSQGTYYYIIHGGCPTTTYKGALYLVE